jgi:hypothetical protein
MANNRPLDRVSGHPALRKSSIMWTRPSSPPRGPLTSREHQPCTDGKDRADTGSNKVGTGEGSARRLGGRHLGRIPRQEGAICRPRHCEGYRTAAPSPLQARVMLYRNLRLRVGFGARRPVPSAKRERRLSVQSGDLRGESEERGDASSPGRYLGAANPPGSSVPSLSRPTRSH